MIRKANITDAESIVKINIANWKITYKNIFPDDLLNNLESKLNDSILKCQNKINEYIVYVKDNKVVAFLRYGINKKDYDSSYAEIYALYVDKDYQGLGIGKSLVDYITKLLKNDFKYILVSTLKENSANAFYQKVGFKKIGNCEFELANKKYLENLYQIEISK